MSLLAWYPLISDLVNNGSGVVTTSGTPTFSTGGKIGNCMTGNDISFTVPSLANSKVWSICFWGYVVSSQITGNWTLLVRVRDNGSHFRFEACPSSYANGIYCYSTHNNASYAICTSGMSAPTGGFYDQWCHVCVTSDGTTISGYYNGQLRSTWAYDGTGAITGVFDLTNNAKCRKNDLRIYDYALSPKEVEILSRGLVLHYPMTGGGRGCANLVPGQAKYTSVSPRVLTTTATDGNSWLSGSAFEVKPSTTYTYSVCCDGQIATKHATDGSEPGTFSMWLYLCNDGTTKNWQSGAYDSPICFTSSNYNHKQVGNRHIWQYTTTATQRYMSIRLNNYGPGTVTNRYWEFKIEESPKFTPYMPNVSESEYTSMYYSNNVEYDVSGYLHNGTINGSVSYSSDTARYSVSTEFSKAGYINVPSFNVDTSAFTLNFWVKMKTATSQHFVLGTFGSWTNNGIGVYRDTNGINYQCLIRSNAESTYKSFALGLSTGTWYMLTLTYDGTNYKGYLNGVLKQNATYGSGGVVSNPVFMVGNSKFNGTPVSENEEAFVSDVRFYATALSAEDIQKLYNTSASIANNGVLMSYEFAET